MIYKTHIGLVHGICTKEEMEMLIALKLYKEANFTRRKGYDEWYHSTPKEMVAITLGMLFKLSTLFIVEVYEDYIELS